MHLKILTEIDAVSGNETAISDFLLSQLSIYADETLKDSMGNLVFYKKGSDPDTAKIALFAHMDEVGLIVKEIHDDGTVRFDEVGGLDDRIMLSQRIKIGENKIKGVIGSKAIHKQSKAERENVVKMNDMYIDIGANSKDDAEKYISKGDYISFESDYTPLFGNLFKAKAIDDRVGCAVMCELIKNSYKNDIYFCFTVQEETGLRGAKVLTRRINPDIAIILEATTASDVPFTAPHMRVTELGKGPALSLMDRHTFYDKDLTRFIAGLADRKKIPYQYKLATSGGNDAGAVQSSASGCRVCAISLPCRYIHSPVSVANMNDYVAMKELTDEFLNNSDEFFLQNIKEDV